MSEYLTLLNLEQPNITADYESNAPTGISLQDIEGMEQFLIGLGTHSGQLVTPEKAKRCATVLACLRILGEDIASLRLPLYKHTQDGPVEVPEHPLHPLINVSPNGVMTGMELREHIMWDLILGGNFYVLKSTDSEGNIESLWPLQSVYVTRRWRELVWVFTDPLTGISGTFTPELVWRGTIGSPNALDGVALTLLAREAIGLLLAAEEQGARLFAHGVQSDLTLESEDTIDDMDSIRSAFQRKYSGARNAFLPIILEGGLKAKRIGLTAQESQYIEARNYQLGDICRVFRIPEVLMGAGTSGKSSTYASAEQFFNSYTKHTLTPWTVRIEQTMHRDLLSLKEQKKYFFKHDFSSLLRADTAGRFAAYETAIASGFMSPAEARRQENWAHKPGLDYYVNLQSTQAPQVDDEAAQQTKPTDQSARRLARLLFQRETKHLTGNGRFASQPEAFYVQHAAWLEDNSGADLDSVLAYCSMRKNTADRFSTESQGKAIAALISLCKKDS